MCNNKSVLCFSVIVFFLYGILTNTLYAWSGGPPAYKTGAPVDSGTCNTSGCHNSFDLNSGTAQFTITGPAAYKPGKTIKLKVSFENSTGKLHGFEMTALDAANNSIGKFKKIGNTTQVIPPNDYRGLEGEDKGKYIEHTAKGNKKKVWRVKWTAPKSATGTIAFYAAGNEGNGDGNYTGDYIYTATLEINEYSE
jgi:hypothetical protein